MSPRILTNVARFTSLTDGGNRESVLDRLLGGGIVLPPHVGIHAPNQSRTEVPRPLVCLITGVPGTGKSTLALEICYRAQLERPRQELSAFYLSLETPADWIIENARTGFGWDRQKQVFEAFRDAEGPDPLSKTVVVLGSEQIWRLPRTTRLHARRLFEMVATETARRGPGLVAVDGVNVLAEDDQEAFVQAVCGRLLGVSGVHSPMLLLLVADFHREDLRRSRWEFIADMVIHLENDSTLGYRQKTLEVEKGRFQEHSLGRHPYKVRPEGAPSPLEEAIMERSARATGVPSEGGFFIFPSVHRLLTYTKRSVARRHERTYLPTPYPALDRIIAPATQAGGLPVGQCTAFLGSRGSLKSHFAYVIALSLSKEHEVLVLSLRDDIHAGQLTLGNILRFEPRLAQALELPQGQRLPTSLRLVYFWPGYISAEQFLYTVQTLVDRSDQKHQVVVIVGLDRIDNRYPLCGAEPIFVPALVSILNGAGCTSIVTSARSRGQLAVTRDADVAMIEGGGGALLPMADLVLEFSPQPADPPHVQIQALRVPGGEVGRARAYATRGPRGELIVDGVPP